MEIYITGDKHGDLRSLVEFSQQNNLNKDDIIIILGDAGINYLPNNDLRCFLAKEFYNKNITCTLILVHGNHEDNPEYMQDMLEKEWRGGTVFYEEEFPNILYLKDGEIYELNGKKVIALGGAYSVDKGYRLTHGWRWFANEQMTPEVRQRCEDNLEKVDWEVDVVLSHTVPISAEPVEFFLPGIDQSKVDKTTEIWLEKIKNKLTYKKWLAGHYHCEVKKPGNIEILFESIKRLE